MRTLLTASAILEAAAGLSLLVWPPAPVSFLFGSALETGVGLAVCRVAGAALFALSVACWLARGDTRSTAGRAVVAGMTFYNIAVVVILAHARIGLGEGGLLLWSAVVLHTAMAGWCINCLRSVRPSTGEPVGTAHH